MHTTLNTSILPNNILLSSTFTSNLTKLLTLRNAPLIIIADYDDTFTKAYINNKKTRTSFGVIDTSVNISSQYTSNAQALGNKCRMYEHDSSIDLAKRKEIMEYWYNSGLTLMVKERISLSLIDTMINEAVDGQHVMFREGTEDFFALMIKHSIPLIIISAGIKQVIIGEFKVFTKHYETMVQKGLLHVIANEFIVDKESQCVVDYVKPTVLTFNKKEFINNEVRLLNENMTEERNVIFIGDHLNDIDAICELKYNAALGFAFYNNPIETTTNTMTVNDALEKEYSEKYDVVIKGDGDFKYINEVINKIKGE